MTKNKIILDPVEIGSALKLSNRVIMAPMTRCMADDDFVPTKDMTQYYAKRAEVGMIIAEATLITRDALGYPNQPGIYSKEQIDGWRTVTDAVHKKEGKIFLQLYHSGRVSHPHYLDGELPIAPSNIPMKGEVPRALEPLEYGPLREMTNSEVYHYINAHVEAAVNAMEAGFDGVEIHAGNGYMIDQFLHWHTNRRTDEFGGSSENMCKFLIEVIKLMSKKLSESAIGVRLSPAAHYNMEHDPRDVETTQYLLGQLSRMDLAYVHTAVFDDQTPVDYLDGSVTQFIRRYYAGTVIGNGGYTAETASRAIERGDCDLVAFGQPILANAGYIDAVRNDRPLKEFDYGMLDTLA